MDVEFEFHATLRDAVGEKTLSRRFDDGTTVAGAIRSLVGECDDLRPLVVRSDGSLRAHLSVSTDGDPLFEADGSGRVLEGGETIVLSPGVAGGKGGDGDEDKEEDGDGDRAGGDAA